MNEDKKTLKEVIKQQLERDAAIRKPQKWEDLYNEEWKVRHIIEDVLGWECFASWESYLHKYHAQEWNLGAGISYSTPTPVAYYAYTEWRVFSEDHEELYTFDPLHNLHDAWKVLQKIVLAGDDVRTRFTADLPADIWTPEQICKAAYEAVHPTEETKGNDQ